MKKLLSVVFILVFFFCPLTVQATGYSFPTDEEAAAIWNEAEQIEFEHEEYLDEMDWLTENDPSFSYAEQFCEDYGIESYRELEQIMEVYYAAMDIGFESYSDMENAIIAENIIEDELGVETVDELLDLQEKYGYGCIDKILDAVDEIGYGELTGDYSNSIKTASPVTESKVKNEEKEMNYRELFLCGIGILVTCFFPLFVFQMLKKKRKEKPHGIDKLS